MAETTLRKELKEAGFDFDGGTVLVRDCHKDDRGWASASELGAPKEATDAHLDEEFYSGYGAPECPVFVAWDADRFYFPVQYDGATWVESIWRDVNTYRSEGTEFPYPGRGLTLWSGG